MSNYLNKNLDENYIIMVIVALIIIAIFVHYNMNSSCNIHRPFSSSNTNEHFDNNEYFDNIDSNNNIEIANIVQDYKCIPKHIIKQKFNKAPSCTNNEIQIGEYCKDYKSDVYRRLCLPSEKYSDGFCVNDCPKNEQDTGNPHICLSKCPDGYLDDGYKCCQIKYIFNN